MEDEADTNLSGTDNIVQWMFRWGAMLPSRFLVGTEGKTAYERRRGRRCNIPTERFGEKVWYKELHGKADNKHKMETDWREGLWLGHSRNSNEILVGTREGVVRAWAIRKKPYEEQWDGDLIKNMKGTPAQPNPLRRGILIPIRITFEEHRRIRRLRSMHQQGPRINQDRCTYNHGCWMCLGILMDAQGVTSGKQDSVTIDPITISAGRECGVRWKRMSEGN